jgi:hypothetical protein
MPQALFRCWLFSVAMTRTPCFCVLRLACSGIVDRAQKELNIEKQIKKIEDTWSVLALVFTPLPDSDVTALQVGCCGTWHKGPCH